MLPKLYKINNFLIDQAFYPIILSTIFALIFYIGRAFYTKNLVVYSNLIWNLFLAWLPYLFAILSTLIHLTSPRRWWLLIPPGAFWLVFFPNAPYILTDFLHLTYRPPVPLWYDIGLLAIFAWSGLFLAVASLRNMHDLIKYHLNWFVGWIFVLSALSLAGLGLYLGRFLRWNSWDLLTDPLIILAEIHNRLVDPLSNLRLYGFTAMFTAILLVCYLMFISVGSRPEKQNSQISESS